MLYHITILVTVLLLSITSNAQDQAYGHSKQHPIQIDLSNMPENTRLTPVENWDEQHVFQSEEDRNYIFMVCESVIHLMCGGQPRYSMSIKDQHCLARHVAKDVEAIFLDGFTKPTKPDQKRKVKKMRKTKKYRMRGGYDDLQACRETVTTFRVADMKANFGTVTYDVDNQTVSYEPYAP